MLNNFSTISYITLTVYEYKNSILHIKLNSLVGKEVKLLKCFTNLKIF